MSSERAPDSSLGTLTVGTEVTEHTLVPRFWLLVVAGPDTGATYASPGDRAIIGTYDTCDLVLHDATVSRFHCEIAPLRGQPSIRDLGSLNGTSVNGVGVVLAHLHSGATIGLGRTQIRFDVGAEQVKVPVVERTRFGTLVGRSLVMRRAFATLERAAAGDATVLVEGEAGTGKRAAAASIHRESARRARPFVVVDCSAVPGDLLAAELFGDGDGPGALEAARGGTVLLTEVADLPAELQPRLMCALERREVRREAAEVPAPIDVRVVAATQRNLRAEVNAKRFRADLYYRLANLEVRLPPLRDRLEDLDLLVGDLLERHGPAARARAVVAAELAERLAACAFPGNVNDLARAVDRELLGGAPALEPAIALDLPLVPARAAFVRAQGQRFAAGLLAEHDDDLAAAARAAGVDPSSFRRLLAGR
jgi:transcriptional regulator with GAF, ATPase, and Fis domain